MSGEQRFQEILNEVRGDLKFLKSDLFTELLKFVVQKGYKVDSDLRDWIYDIFLDKLFEIDVKIRKIISDLAPRFTPELPWIALKVRAEKIACDSYITDEQLKDDLLMLCNALDDYANKFESTMGSLRYILHENNWIQVKKLKSEDYILPTTRAKYVQARDELKKAKQAVKDKQWDEVLNHLRPAIDLALKEKFEFKKINPMKQFLQDAEKFNLPLPSYTMLYDYFDEGSQRIHAGKLNTPFECQNALEFVAGFIDRLELINVTPKEIGEFKKKSKAVE
jgi:hypothetical protein